MHKTSSLLLSRVLCALDERCAGPSDRGATREQSVGIRIRLHQRLVECALGRREADVLVQPLG